MYTISIPTDTWAKIDSAWVTYGGDFAHSGSVNYSTRINANTSYEETFVINMKQNYQATSIAALNDTIYYNQFYPTTDGNGQTFIKSYSLVDKELLWESELQFKTPFDNLQNYTIYYCSGPTTASLPAAEKWRKNITNQTYLISICTCDNDTAMVTYVTNVGNHTSQRSNTS